MVASPRTIEKTGVLRITASVQYRAVIGRADKNTETASGRAVLKGLVRSAPVYTEAIREQRR